MSFAVPSRYLYAAHLGDALGRRIIRALKETGTVSIGTLQLRLRTKLVGFDRLKPIPPAVAFISSQLPWGGGSWALRFQHSEETTALPGWAQDAEWLVRVKLADKAQFPALLNRVTAGILQLEREAHAIRHKQQLPAGLYF